MKISKEYLKKLIMEELNEVELSTSSHHPGFADTPETKYGFTQKAGPGSRYDAAKQGILEVMTELGPMAAGIKTYNKETGERLEKLANKLKDSYDELLASMKHNYDS